MAKPHIHSASSVHSFKGKPKDYTEIHRMMDSSKEWFPDNRHRAIFHHSGGIFIMEKIFGVYFEGIKELQEKYNLPDTFEDDIIKFLENNRNFGTCIKNSDGKKISVRDIAEQHVLEDYKLKFIPTPQDFLQEMEFQPWMQNGMGDPPSSHKKIAETNNILPTKTRKKDTNKKIEVIKAPEGELIKNVPRLNFNPSSFVMDGMRNRDNYDSKTLD